MKFFKSLAILLLVLLPLDAAATITRVGSTTAAATTITCPTHAVGDLIMIEGVRASSGTAPTLPSGYVSLLTVAQGANVSVRVGWKIATSTSDASGTWTNAGKLICVIYRPSSGSTLLPGQYATSSSTTTTVTYPALSPMADSSTGNSWVVGFFAANNTTQTMTAPTGMTNVTSIASTSPESAIHDTNAGVSSWSVQTVSSGTGNSVSGTIELVLLPSTTLSNVYQYVGGGTNWAGKSATSSTTYTLPFDTVSGAGNTIVFGFSTTGGITVTSVTGSCNGSYGSPKVTATGGGLDSRLYVFPNIAHCSTPEIITVVLGTAEHVFSYFMGEYYGVSTSAFTASSGVNVQSRANSTTINTGSMTPPNNNGTGGNLIISWHQKSDTTPTVTTTELFAGANFIPETLNNAYGFTDGNPYAVQAFVQTTSAAITPTVVSQHDSVDNWNSLAVALPIAVGSGTSPPGGIQIRTILHMTTGQFPATGTYRMRVPFSGNLFVVGCTDPALNTITVNDSTGAAWSVVSTSGIAYLANATANPNLEVFVTGGGGDSNVSWRTVDITGAATSPFDSGALIDDSSTGTTYTPSVKASPSNTNGLVLYNVGLGTGPGLAVTAPSGALWDLANYTGETDVDGLENADIMAHYFNTATGTITATFTVTVSTSSSGGYVAFKAAPAPSVAPSQFFLGDLKLPDFRDWLIEPSIDARHRRRSTLE